MIRTCFTVHCRAQIKEYVTTQIINTFAIGILFPGPDSNRGPICHKIFKKNHKKPWRNHDCFHRAISYQKWSNLGGLWFPKAQTHHYTHISCCSVPWIMVYGIVTSNLSKNCNVITAHWKVWVLVAYDESFWAWFLTGILD